MNPIKTLKQLKSAISAVQALPEVPGCRLSKNFYQLRPELVIGVMRANLVPGAHFYINDAHGGGYYISLNQWNLEINLYSDSFTADSYYYKSFEILEHARPEN